MTVFQNRRQRVYDAIGANVAILFAAPERIRSNDTEYPYRQDSYFYYLSGFTEPEAVMLLDGNKRQTTLFCRPKDAAMETWTGYRFGPKQAAISFGFDAALVYSQWQTQLKEALKHTSVLYGLWQHDGGADHDILSIWQQLCAQAGQRLHDGDIITPAHSLADLAPILDTMRLIKDDVEVAQLKTAAQLSAQAHTIAMQHAHAGMSEYQLEADILHHFMRNNARSPAYNSIVASGANACTLHYVANQDVLQDGQLVLIDAGAEYQYYAGDITRTFPVNGRFSGAQRAVYDIVLEANKQAIAAIKPGVEWQHITDTALKILVQGMVDLKLLRDSVDDIIAKQSYKRFYMHGIGHWIGLDVHDVGGRFYQGAPRLLQANMCTTIEPGLYINAADDVPAPLHGIGIRIEDNIRVTANGHENYTANVVKEVADIEALMRTHRR